MEQTLERPAVAVHCPFGCKLEEHDSYGYCPHLVGFTNDGKFFEPIEDHHNMHGERTGQKFVNGKHKQRVMKTDQLVNPIREYRDKGILKLARAWVSSRVYRACVEGPKPVGEAELTEEMLEEATRPQA